MDKLRKRLFSILGIIGVIVLGVFGIAQTTHGRVANEQAKLIGGWSVEATTSGQGKFPALFTFTPKGGMIASESPSPFESSGHGAWAASGDKQVKYTFIALFGSEQGANTGKLKVVGKLNYNANADTWKGPFKIDVYDGDGNVVFSDTGTFKLTRIAVESLP